MPSGPVERTTPCEATPVRHDGAQRDQGPAFEAEVLTFRPDAGPTSRCPADLVAYTIARVMAGFIYNDPLAAVDVQLDKAMEVLDYLLAERAPRHSDRR